MLANRTLAMTSGGAAREKALTRHHDQVNAERRRLPMVCVDKEYIFEGPEGKVTLARLFAGKRQLIVQHVMFGLDWDAPCPSCSKAIPQMTPTLFEGLRNRETTFVLASLAPYEKIAAAKAERGWDVPWYSSYGSDFNFDYNVSFDSSRDQPGYNYGTMRQPRVSFPVPAVSFAMAATSITRIRRTRAAWNTPPAALRTSTTPRWDGKSPGKSPRAGRMPCTRPTARSAAEPPSRVGSG